MHEGTFLAIRIVVFVLVTCAFAVRLWVDLDRHINRIRSTAYVVSVSWASLAYAVYAITFGLSMFRAHEILFYAHRREDLLFIPVLGVPLDKAEISLKVLVVPSFTVPVCLWAVKASFTTMYFKITAHLTRTMRSCLFGLALYLVLSFTAVMLTYFLWCLPFKKRWALSITEYCNEGVSVASLVVYTVLHVTSDALVMALPIYILRTLRIKRGEKLAIAFLLSLGTLTVAISLARFVLMLRLSRISRLAMSYEQTLSPEILIDAEMGAAVLASSLPSLRARLYGGHRELVPKSYRTPASDSYRSMTVPLDDEDEGYDLEAEASRTSNPLEDRSETRARSM